METENTRRELPKATCDQEAWVKDRIETAIRMALALNKNRFVGADDPAYTGGLNGIVNGTAYEIISLLGMEPSYINVKNPYGKPSPESILPLKNILEK